MQASFLVSCLSTISLLYLIIIFSKGSKCCTLRGETEGICINKTLLGDDNSFCSSYIHETVCVPIFSVNFSLNLGNME